MADRRQQMKGTERMSEYKFGQLVKAKLCELGMNQSDLARRVNKGRSYINYVVTGKNKSAQSKQSRPNPRLVEQIARELGIPTDEAFTAAGWHKFVGKSILGEEIGNAAAARAKASKGPGAGASDHGSVTFDLPGDMHLILVNEGSALTDDQIERYRLAFTTAAEVVRTAT